jgi:hypothetical protein
MADDEYDNMQQKQTRTKHNAETEEDYGNAVLYGK